jgi:high affinity Mn2+ porin
MNAQGEPGDVGLSRYPPAEGERAFDRRPSVGVDQGRGDTGVSRYPPAEGERSTPPGERAPPAGAEPNDDNGAAGPLPPTTLNGAEAEVVTQILAAQLWESGADASQVLFNYNPQDAEGAGLSRPSANVFFPRSEITRAGFTDAEPAPFFGAVNPCGFFGNGGEQDNPGARQGDTGVSTFPPAEGERNAQPEPIPTIGVRQRYTGLSKFPPAEGERDSSSGAPGPLGPAAWYSAHVQGTVVSQVHNVFPSPYIGKKSLLPNEPAANTMTGTVFWAGRIWESERGDGQIVFNPEIAGGGGFSGTAGIAGFPNGEATRVGVPNPTPYIARLYLRQTFGFGGEREWAGDDVNQVAGERDVRRLAVIVGKFAAPDIADDNRYSHDPRTQFLNWALVYNGAWDYPANVRGYTYGVAFDYNHSKNLSFSYAVMTEPLVANGSALDWHLNKAQGQVAEMERRYKLFGRPGSFRTLAFLNHAHMGDYNEALQLMPVDPNIIKTRAYRYKYGFGLNVDQELTDDIGFFSRLGWNDGHSETWAFTEIDRTATAGLVMGGRQWCRPYDRVGLAGILNGLSGPHRDYLAAGGYGFIIGDGKLNYGLEQILEMYYAIQIKAGLYLTFDFQEVGNPAYNRDRGPVSVYSLRVHWDR